MASVHDPRADEQRYANANRLIVQQTSHASHRALRVRRGVRSRLTGAQQTDALILGGDERVRVRAGQQGTSATGVLGLLRRASQFVGKILR